MRFLLLMLFAAVLSGCATYRPPGPPVPRGEAPVAASFGKTWDAVIDYFSEHNIPIATIERASGVVVASQSYLGGGEDRLRIADCGATGSMGVLAPTRVSYNVRVKGDSTSSRLRVNATFESNAPGGPWRCSSKGAWETELEVAIRHRAEVLNR